jgi:phosphate-transporting ATPase
MLRLSDLSWHTRHLELLEVPAGECVVVTGPSGAGKSRLLRAVADLEPNTGAVEAYGAARDAMPAPAWRLRVSYLAATSGWWADTVAPHFTDLTAAAPLFSALGLAADCPVWQVSRLSSGERQRLALVRSLLLNPRVLLLDEPTASLDAEAEAAVERLILDRLAGGACAMLVTHDRAQAARLAKRAVVLDAAGTRVGAL